MKRSLIPVAAIAGALTAIISVTPAAASAAAPSDGELGPRLERACLRVPNLEVRTANLIERLEGDATTRGSLAWLQAQIDKATSRNRTDLVEVLQNRLAVRQQTLVVLQQRQAGLPALRQFCIDHGVEI